MVGSIIPDFFKDNEKTIEDKVFAKTVGKAAARRVGWWVQLSEKMRTELLDLKESFITIQLDLEKVVGYIEAAEQLADFELVRVSDLSNCNCKKNGTTVARFESPLTGWELEVRWTFLRGRNGQKSRESIALTGVAYFSAADGGVPADSGDDYARRMFLAHLWPMYSEEQWHDMFVAGNWLKSVAWEVK